MNKAVLISIRPKWCELIANGQKTIELRKTKPKIQTPFKCYIYCTRAKSFFQENRLRFANDELYRLPNGQIKFGSGIELMLHDAYTVDNFLSGKVIGEFICDEVIEWHEDSAPPVPLKLTGMTYPEIRRYWNDNIEKIYLWHISNLVIYDEPKELSEFYTLCEDFRCEGCEHLKYMPVNSSEYDYECEYDGYRKPILRAPQSWCYVEEVNSNDADA